MEVVSIVAGFIPMITSSQTANSHQPNNPIIAVCVIGEVAPQSVDNFFVLLFVFAAVGSTQATEVDRFTFCCFKHGHCDKYAREKDCVNCCTYAKHQD